MEEVAGPSVGRLPEVRGYLGTFLFGEDDVNKQVGVLSGGEKARLALARMLMDPAGLLLLDEPTNHLDMDSRAVLTEALRQFDGSAVFISHDRHLINAIGTKVIEVRLGKLAHYRGDWEYYLWKKGRAAEPGASAKASPEGFADAADLSDGGGRRKSEPPSSDAERPNGGGRGRPEVPRLSYKERKELQRRHRQLERRIITLEERQETLSALLSDPAHASDYELLVGASAEAAAVRDELSTLYPEWESLAETVAVLDEERA